MNRVALIAGGSQFMHRILTLPAMSEKKRMAVLSHELASGGAEVKAPLDDYMLLSRDARTRGKVVRRGAGKADRLNAVLALAGRVELDQARELLRDLGAGLPALLSWLSPCWAGVC